MTTFRIHAEPIQDQWLDAYGHLNEAYYLVPFSNATWAFQEHFDIGVAYFDTTGGAMYTAESHVRYLADVRAPAQIEIETMVLACDAKRLHFAHAMWVGDSMRATFECLAIHFDSRAERTAPLPGAAQRALTQICLPQSDWPDWIGRRISMQR